MERTKFKPYEHRHCRFKMRSGKEVFGIIWEHMTDDEKSNYYFSSSGEYEKYKASLKDNAPQFGFPLQLEDVIYAEIIAA